jgi:hypothetical protein
METMPRRIPTLWTVVLAVLLATGGPMPTRTARAQRPSPAPTPDPALREAAARARRELTQKHGAAQRERIDRGVRQVASLWQSGDGDAEAFVRFLNEHFVADPKALDATLGRFEHALEQLDGHFVEIGREMRRHTELDLGPLLPVDRLFAAFDAGANVGEDLFRSRLAFAVLANFPLSTLKERIERGSRWSRRRWGETRLAGRFARRVPGSVQQKISEASAHAELYIAEYNIYMHHVVPGWPPGGSPHRVFPKGLRLISHWNLRDELKSHYADATQGLLRQRLIAQVMERIVEQSIPKAVINNPRLDWNPETNEVRVAPAATIEADAAAGPAIADPTREPDTRYAHLLECFHAARAADPYSPLTPSMIARRFEIDREIPEKRVEAMLKQVLTSPIIPRLGKLIQKRLGRPLEPFDIWYDGFRTRSKYPEAELDAQVRRRYPDVGAFQRDLSGILERLGFTPARARYLADRIVVDPSRGAGHALGAGRRQDKPHLRTRIEKTGMNYKGYNIAVHELGHNVEQVFSLYDVDHTLLAGVPNTAFTEALAFVFQARDLEVLGLARPDAKSERLKVLSTLWATYEIGGVALVDMEVWRWMYAHPQATPAQLREATLHISRRIWNLYYAPVLGKRDVALLGVYSHMISSFLYLPDYPIGHLIAFQIEDHIKKQAAAGGGRRVLGTEFERMARYGSVTPDLWMKHATGRPISPEVLLEAAGRALAEE